MKKNFFLGLSIILITLMASCVKKDSCSGVCQNGGTCINNSCSCPSGYEGSNCQTKSNEKFIGTYIGSINCDFTGNTPDTCIITAGSNPLSITITESSSVDPMSATIDGSSITIPSQTTASGYTAHGSGTLLGGNINLNVVLEGGGNTANCAFVGAR